jgi:DNA uptake protein ComE-like DNA-binding protein
MARTGVPVLAAALAAALIIPACGLLRREHAEQKPAPAAIDLNDAALRKVEKLPGVTPTMARRIVEGRPYEDPHDLVARGILTEREYARIADLVVVRRSGR